MPARRRRRNRYGAVPTTWEGYVHRCLLGRYVPCSAFYFGVQGQEARDYEAVKHMAPSQREIDDWRPGGRLSTHRAERLAFVRTRAPYIIRPNHDEEGAPDKPEVTAAGRPMGLERKDCS